MAGSKRLARINTRMQQELTELLLFELNDPRLAGITITGVKVDRELSYANIYVSSLGGASRSKEVLQGLEHASNYIRKYLSEKIVLRSFPRLRFYWDNTPENADKIEKIINEIKKEEQGNSTIEND